MPYRPRPSASICLATLVIAAGCGERATPAAPTPAQPDPVLSRIRVEGPARIAPGSDTKFTVWARFTDATERDVTEHARLVETNVGCDGCEASPILRIGEGGMVHAVAVGEAGLLASYRHEQHEAVDGHHRVLVLPEGTFRLSGALIEVDSGGRRIQDVEVRLSSEAGHLRTQTSVVGIYNFYGVRGVTRLTVVSDYHERLQHDLVVDDDKVLDFQIRPVILRADEAASLVISAAAECPTSADGALPEAARQRRYAAMLTTAKDDRVFVRLTGGHFATFPLEGGGTGGNGFVGQRSGSGYFFGIRGFHNDFESVSYPDILEQLSESQFLTFEGATTISGGSRLHGRLEGTIAVYGADLRPGPGGWWQPREATARCTSANHEFTLTK